MKSSLRCKQQEIWDPDWLHAWAYLNNYTQLSWYCFKVYD